MVIKHDVLVRQLRVLNIVSIAKVEGISGKDEKQDWKYHDA
jgi:hypothetical protein